MDSVRLFVGSSPDGSDYEAEAVLAYSVRKHASVPVSITWMRQSTTGDFSGWKSNATARTPFSHYRWSLPALTGYKGRAIYADTDVLFMSDIAELATAPIPGVILCQKLSKPGGKIRTCCMVVDCEKARGHIPVLTELKRMSDPQGSMTRYFIDRPQLAHPYGCGNWNTRDPKTADELYAPSTKAVHYTRIEHQCHLPHAQRRLKAQGRSHWYSGPMFPHPNQELQRLFDRLLDEAKEAGYTYDSFGYDESASITRRDFTYKAHRGGVPA